MMFLVRVVRSALLVTFSDGRDKRNFPGLFLTRIIGIRPIAATVFHLCLILYLAHEIVAEKIPVKKDSKMKGVHYWISILAYLRKCILESKPGGPSKSGLKVP